MRPGVTEYRQSAITYGANSTANTYNIVQPPSPPEPFSAESLIGNIPCQNPCFSGREDKLAALGTALSHAQHSLITQSVVGMGGVGKTQLVAEYVHRFKKQYALIAWLDGKTPLQSYIKLGERLGLQLDLKESEEQTITSIEQQLKKYASLLFVWDDALNQEQMSPYLVSAHRLKAHCLITSRAQYWEDSSLNRICLNVFDEEEALAYFKERFKNKIGLYQETHAKTLAKQLGHLPLALAQAAAYLLKKRQSSSTYSIEKYLTEYSEMKHHYKLPLTPTDCYSHKTVWTTWYLSIDAIRLENKEEAAHLLEMCAYLEGNALAHEFLQKLTDSTEEQLSDMIESLLEYSLVERVGQDGNTIKIHQILQSVIRLHLQEEPLSPSIPLSLPALEDAAHEEGPIPEALMMRRYLTDKDSQWRWNQREKALNYPPNNPSTSPGELAAARAQKENPATALRKLVIPSAHNTQHHHMITLLLKQLQKSFQYDEGQMEQLHAVHSLFAPHIKAACNHALTSGVGEPGAVSLLYSLGELTHHLKDAKVMQETFLKILPYYEHCYSNHPLLAHVLNNLAIAYEDLGDYQEQQRLLQRALVIQERHYGPEDVEVAGTLNNLANAYGALGDHQKKKGLLQRALIIKECHYGPEDVEVAVTLNNLATAHGDLGEHQEKKRLLQRALVIFERDYGPEHVQVASTLNNLATAYEDLGELQSAQNNYHHALRIFQHLFREAHPQVGLVFNNLAMLHVKQKEFALGLPYLQKAHAIFIDSPNCGPTHPYTLKTIAQLEELASQMSKLEATAQQHFTSKKNVFETKLAANQAHQKGVAYYKEGHWTEALIAFQEGLEKNQRFFGEQFHEDLALSHWCLSSCYLKQADYIQALAHVDKAYTLRRALLGEAAELTQKAKERFTLCKEKVANNTSPTSSPPIHPQESIMPMPYDYALMSQAIYSDSLSVEGSNQPIPEIQQALQDKGWRLLAFVTPKSDYRGGIWVHHASKEIAIAHRGSQNATSWVTDVESIVQHKPGAFVNDALELLRHPAVLQYRKDGFRLSATGHSLGGFLAQVCVYWSQRQDFNETHHPEMSAMVFDSPGAGDFLETLQSNLKREQSRVNLHHLNIHNFCVMPTIVSTFGTSIATTWHLPGADNIENAFFNAHKMEYILQGFNPTTGQPLRFQQMLDWPKADYSAYDSVSNIISTGLQAAVAMPFACLNQLYKNMKYLRNRDLTATYYDQLAQKEGQVQYFLRAIAGKTQPPTLEEVTDGLRLALKAHYSAYDEQKSKKRIDIHHFNTEVQIFLQSFKLAKSLIKDNSWQKALEERYGEVGCRVLQSFVIEEQEDKVELVLSSTDDSSIFDFQTKLNTLLQTAGCLSFMDFLANTIVGMKSHLEDAKEGSKLAKELQEKVRTLEEAQAVLETRKASCESNDTLEMYVVAGAAVNQPGATAINTNENIRIEDIVAMQQAAPRHTSAPLPGTSRVTVIAGAVSTATGGIAENRNIFYRPSPQTTPATDSKEEARHPK